QRGRVPVADAPARRAGRAERRRSAYLRPGPRTHPVGAALAPRLGSRVAARAPLLQEAGDGFAVAGGDGVAVAVDAARHHPLAAHLYRVHQVAVAAEDPAIDEVGFGSSGQL